MKSAVSGKISGVSFEGGMSRKKKLGLLHHRGRRGKEQERV